MEFDAAADDARVEDVKDPSFGVKAEEKVDGLAHGVA